MQLHLHAGCLQSHKRRVQPLQLKGVFLPACGANRGLFPALVARETKASAPGRCLTPNLRAALLICRKLVRVVTGRLAEMDVNQVASGENPTTKRFFWFWREAEGGRHGNACVCSSLRQKQRKERMLGSTCRTRTRALLSLSLNAGLWTINPISIPLSQSPEEEEEPFSFFLQKDKAMRPLLL